MIVTRNRLQEIVEADKYMSWFVPLKVDSIYEFRKDLEVDGTDSNTRLLNEVEPFGGIEYRLSANTYRVEFDAEIEDTGRYVPHISPSGNAIKAGCTPVNRYATDGELWTALRVAKGCKISVTSTIGILTVYDSMPGKELQKHV